MLPATFEMAFDGIASELTEKQT